MHTYFFAKNVVKLDEFIELLHRFDRHITFDKNIGRKQNRIRWKAEIASFPTRVGSISADTYEESYALIKYIIKLRS